MKKIITLGALALCTLSSCATIYKLKPTAEAPRVIDGKEYQESITPDCVVSATYDVNDGEELRVRVEITNKTNQTFDILPSAFALRGPFNVVIDGPLATLEPDAFLKKLSTDADLYEERNKTNNWEGVDILTDTLGTEKDDAQLEKLKRDHVRNTKEGKENVKTAVKKREKRAQLEGKLLKRTTLKKGEKTTGLILFPSRFKDEGLVDLEVKHPSCMTSLSFKLTK